MFFVDNHEIIRVGYKNASDTIPSLRWVINGPGPRVAQKPAKGSKVKGFAPNATKNLRDGYENASDTTRVVLKPAKVSMAKVSHCMFFVDNYENIRDGYENAIDTKPS